jgi:hypothetical protein
MARPKTYKDLQYLADVAKAREQARAAHQATKALTYTPRKKGDYNTYFYIHPITSNKAAAGNLIVEYSLKTAIVDAVGATNCQLLSAAPPSTSPVSRKSLIRFPAVMIKWYAGDAQVTKERTAWGSTWIKKYDKSSTLGQSHFSLPFGGTNADTLDDVVSRFDTLFNLTNGTKKDILGVNGYIELMFGEQRIKSFQADG